MSAKTIKELNEDGRKLALEIKSIHDKGEDATVEEMLSLETKSLEAEKIGEQLEKYAFGGATNINAAKALDRLENSMAALKTINRPAMGGDGSTLPGGNGAYGREIKSAGQLFVESDRFQGYLKSIMPGDRIPERTSISTPPIELKTLYTSAGDVSASRPLLGQADRRDEIVRLGWNILNLRGLISNLTTNSDTVEVVRELTHTSNADFVAESTATSGGVGVKPESAMTYEVVPVVVQTIAHWIPASTRVLADARRLAGEIDSFLRMGLDQKAEDAILNGSGTSPAWTGVNNTSGILTQAFSTDLLTTTRKARTKLKTSGYTIPTAFVFAPADWETLDLTKDGQNRYYFGGPLEMGTPRLWGVPAVESMFQASGYSLLANWADVVMYDREQTSVSISNQHSDFFIRNLVAILAEMRAAFHVRRPTSVVRIAHS